MMLDDIRWAKWASPREEKMALVRLLDRGGLTSGQRAWICRRLKRLDGEPTVRDKVVGPGRRGGLTKKEREEVQLRQKAKEVFEECRKVK